MADVADTEQAAMMMAAQPQKEHVWLQKLIGDWTIEGQAPDMPGIEHVRALGDLWIVGEGRGGTEAGADVMMLTLGYDPERGRFVGTYVSSMMANLWVYEGELDAAGQVLTLNTEGPSMAGDGTMAPYRETIEFKSDDHWQFASNTLGADGKWEQFMSTEYRRKA